MTKKKADIREHAKELAKLGARKGGHARAAVLTAQERREIARQAVLVRWRKQKGDSYQGPTEPPPERPAAQKSGGEAPRGDGIPRSVCQGRVRIGPLDLVCHVLSDGRRVFDQDGIAPGRRGARGDVSLQAFLSRVPTAPGAPVAGPEVKFLASKSGAPGSGYDATWLVEVANAYLVARDEGRLTAAQESLARHSSQITRSLAKVGVNALVDSATGFDLLRLRRSLQIEIQAFIAHDIQEWAASFPEEFWLELARLEGVRYLPRSRPLRWGRYVMLFVYDAIDQDVEGRLRVARPDLHFRADHHRWLREFSREKLNRHMLQIVGTMKRCENLEQFRSKLERVFSRVPKELNFSQSK